MSRTVIYTNARVVTPPPGPTHRKGRAMGELLVYPRAHIYATDGIIDRIEPAIGRDSPTGDNCHDMYGKVLLPALIDCHTHHCWAGSRVDEWEQRLAGASYLDTLKSGGGIMSTVRAVRASDDAHLQSHLLEHVGTLSLREGIGLVEVKSGYGLTTAHELRMLRAVRDCNANAAGAALGSARGPRLVATALLGHAIDPDVPRDRFTRMVIEETLPVVSHEFPGIAIDAFCEEGAWSLEECQALFRAALRLGHPCRVHADQFHALGMVPWACEQGFRSVDHLEASTPESVEAIAASNTVGVVLPACGFHLDGRYANARRLIDAGAAVALATNSNPGSAPCSSMAMVMALGVRHCGMTWAEAITAATVNAAHVLGSHDMGVIAPGMQAAFAVLNSSDERTICYEFLSVVSLVTSGDLLRP
jgi:imidazolonepropionase